MESLPPKRTYYWSETAYYSTKTQFRSCRYLEVQSDIDLTILEAEDSIGGIWSRRRAHPTLLTQQPYGSYEYADMTLDTAGVTDPKNSYIPSETLHSYMEDYAQRFGIMDKVRFNTKVKKIERASPPELGWRIWSQNSSESEGPLIFDKVVVATGMSSNPSIPQISTANFAPPVFHTMELGDRRDWISSDQVKNITIYGGGKSAVDAMYMSVKNGKQVDWVIRPDSIGNGVPPLFSAYFRGRATNETISTRLMSKLFPSLDSLDDWWYRFFHSGTSRLGAWLHWKFFGMFNDMLVKLMGYDKNENMKKLKPVVLDHA